MAEYNYVFGSLRTEKIIAEIPLYGTYMDLELNVGGRFDGSFQLDQTGVSNTTLLDATVPGRTFVAVERNGKPVWIGYVWSRTYQSQSKSVQIFAQSFEYFPYHQLIRSDFSRLNTDQIQVFIDLWDNMQAVTGRLVNIETPAVINSSFNIDVDVLATDFKYYGEIISSFADAESGFDWTIDVARSENFYIKTIRYGYPVVGSPDPSRLVFEYPGNILNYYATESMANAGTHIFALGAGEGSSMIFGTANDRFGQVANGGVRWDLAISRKDVNKQSLINSIATQEAITRNPPRLIIKSTMKSEVQPEFGSFSLGDACTFAIKDARFPAGKQIPARIVKWTLNPQSSENADQYNVVIAGDDDE